MVLKLPFRLMSIMRVEGGIVGVGDVCQRHHAGVVDQHVDAAERRDRLGEQAAHVVRLADIGLAHRGEATGLLDLARQRLGGRGALGIVDHDREAVTGETLGDRRADAARGTGDECDLTVLELVGTA